MRTLGLLPLTVGLVLAGVVACNDLTDPEPPPRPDLLGAPTALKRIKVAEPVNEPPYRRAMFGDGWGDVDRDGCNTREEIMARDLTDVTFEDDRQGEPDCNVIAGTLAEKYTGRTLRYREEDSQAVQIDHVVALSRAWRLGAWQWATTERKAFANDPLNLLAVDGPTNSRKSDQGPGTLDATEPCLRVRVRPPVRAGGLQVPERAAADLPWRPGCARAHVGGLQTVTGPVNDAGEPVYTLAEAAAHLAEKFCRVLGHDLRIVRRRDLPGLSGADPAAVYCGRCYHEWTVTPDAKENHR